MAACSDCGSNQDAGTCDALFHRLLALDHSRQPPWGPLHAVAVACFFLQHPRHPQAPGDLQTFRALVLVWLSSGNSALRAATEAIRRGRFVVPNRNPSSSTSDNASGSYTIQDVAVDGTFPAAGYQSRVRRWAAHCSGMPSF